jgi:hypothetical protein
MENSPNQSAIHFAAQLDADQMLSQCHEDCLHNSSDTLFEADWRVFAWHRTGDREEYDSLTLPRWRTGRGSAAPRKTGTRRRFCLFRRTARVGRASDF